MAAIKTMAVVDQANQLGRVLPPEAFYNELIRCIRPVTRVSVLLCQVLNGRWFSENAGYAGSHAD
jgi:hypothetical protein